MDGLQGRDEVAVKAVTGLEVKRPRRWVKMLERLAVFHPGDGALRLGRLGRFLRDAAEPGGMRILVAREVIPVLWRYQFDNPVERGMPRGCSVHPYWAILKAAAELDWKIHWDEVDRELMRIKRDEELEAVINRIRTARLDPGYSAFLGGGSNGPGLLRGRAHPAKPSAPAGKTPEGQLRDQKMTPFLKRAGFGELLLESPGGGGGGYWTVPSQVRAAVTEALSTPPEAKDFPTTQEWIEWFCEGDTAPPAAPNIPPLSPPPVAIPLANLTLAAVKAALAAHEPHLRFSDALLASVVAALRAGDGKNFVILRGVSGTGKSRLVAAIAKAVYGMAAVPAPWLTMIEVRPDWADGMPLLGHYATVESRYVRRPFLDALLAARDTPGAPVFVCLDEMNLARVEYYLAEFLSAMESGIEVPLDRRGDMSVPPGLAWQPNLCLFGTINVDETTLPVSDKVLDRAQVIDTSDINLAGPLDGWLSGQAGLDDEEKARIRDIVTGIWGILAQVGAQFGFRTARAVVRFVAEAKASSGGALDVNAALDLQLRQKILVKLRGEGESWSVALEALQAALAPLGNGPGSASSVVTRMRADLERLGSFQFWS
ncbi:McrB family protein [Roseomonas sp. F4]